MRFKIPLPNGRTVFMNDDMSKLRIIVWVSTKKFLQLWDTYQQNDTVVTNTKYPYAETCFAQSERYPVPVADAGDIRTDVCLLVQQKSRG